MLGCVVDRACHGIGAVAGSLNLVKELEVKKEETGNWGNEGYHDDRNIKHASDRTQGRQESVITAQETCSARFFFFRAFQGTY